jgi:hypothetical protein
MWLRENKRANLSIYLYTDGDRIASKKAATHFGAPGRSVCPFVVRVGAEKGTLYFPPQSTMSPLITPGLSDRGVELAAITPGMVGQYLVGLGGSPAKRTIIWRLYAVSSTGWSIGTSASSTQRRRCVA